MFIIHQIHSFIKFKIFIIHQIQKSWFIKNRSSKKKKKSFFFFQTLALPQIDVDDPIELFRGSVVDGPQFQDTSIVDQHIQGALEGPE